MIHQKTFFAKFRRIFLVKRWGIFVLQFFDETVIDTILSCFSDLQIVRSGLEDFVTDSNEALNFKLVRNESDLKDDTTTFKPEMSHQIYGDK